MGRKTTVLILFNPAILSVFAVFRLARWSDPVDSSLRITARPSLHSCKSKQEETGTQT